MKITSVGGWALVATALPLILTACAGGSTNASPPVTKQQLVFPAPPPSGEKEIRAFWAAHPNRSRAQSVTGQFHVARDGVSRVYENHATFVLPGYQITGHVSGLVLGPHHEVTILADFLHGDKIVRRKATLAVSSLEIGS